MRLRKPTRLKPVGGQGIAQKMCLKCLPCFLVFLRHLLPATAENRMLNQGGSSHVLISMDLLLQLGFQFTLDSHGSVILIHIQGCY